MQIRTFPAFAPFFLATVSWAQTPTPRLRVGDTLPSGDHVTFVGTSRIDDHGSWLSIVDSDFADAIQDAFLLRDGQVLLREGASLAGPAGATLDDFFGVASNAGGDVATLLKVHQPFVTFDGLYFNARPVAVNGDLVGAPEVPAATTWDRFIGVWLNDARTLLVLGEINNPDFGSAREDALARVQLDAAGAVVSTNVLLTKGQFVPALNGTVRNVGNLVRNCAFNGHGDFMSVVYLASGARAVLRNLDTVLAREGQPSPIAGRSYQILALSKVALNDFGDYAFTATLDGTTDTYCIFKNGQKFALAGDVLPFLSSPLANGTAAPIFLGALGELFWRADDVDGDGEAFVRGMDVIVQANSTLVGGALVTELSLREDAFHVSPDGRFWAGRVVLQNVGDALLTADFGLVAPWTGCTPSPARLRKASGEALTGQRLTLELDGAQALGALPAVLFGTRGLRSSAGCGFPVAGGELLVEPASHVATLLGAPWAGTPVPFAIDIPPDAALVDLELFAQGVFADASSSPRLRLANGLRLQIGAP